MRRLLVFLLVMLVLPATAGAATPPYLTIFADRAQWVEASCTTKQARPGAVTLGTAVSDLHARGLNATFGVVTKFQNESTRKCADPAFYASWDDLRGWHSQYGMEATSAGKTKLILTKATDTQLQDETCGSLPIFQQHGFNRAWGMFSYPNDQFNAHTQAIVLSCFAWGRDYSNQVNTQPGSSGFAYTKQVRGGDSATYNGQAPQRYTPPSEIIPYIQPRAGQWRILQFYRFVTGAQPGMWDCTGAASAHWTWKTETYCYTDWQAILDAIPASVVTTDPATVAQAWNRQP